jgi:hypothetical protein
MVILKRWGFIGTCLYGDVYNDPRWEDGRFIKVSRIIYPDVSELREGIVIKTMNSTYLLGKRA